mmetsp:Transcript_115752/g.327337  ORF Transcript_115752/g.327337 Transcript_115752/m.327337 type:complete len:257 (+) Transcript_115752:106-876(+)
MRTKTAKKANMPRLLVTPRRCRILRTSCGNFVRALIGSYYALARRGPQWRCRRRMSSSGGSCFARRRMGLEPSQTTSPQRRSDGDLSEAVCRPCSEMSRPEMPPSANANVPGTWLPRGPSRRSCRLKSKRSTSSGVGRCNSRRRRPIAGARQRNRGGAAPTSRNASSNRRSWVPLALAPLTSSWPRCLPWTANLLRAPAMPWTHNCAGSRRADRRREPKAVSVTIIGEAHRSRDRRDGARMCHYFGGRTTPMRHVE